MYIIFILEEPKNVNAHICLYFIHDDLTLKMLEIFYLNRKSYLFYPSQKLQSDVLTFL